MTSKEPENKDDDLFSEEERTTANLRLRSVSPGQRTFLGFFAFIPRAWRGPVAIVLVLTFAYVLLKAGPHVIEWLRQK